jgi:hypothetical protein
MPDLLQWLQGVVVLPFVELIASLPKSQLVLDGERTVQVWRSGL